jgi:signal recognition particle subunit SRP54
VTRDYSLNDFRPQLDQIAKMGMTCLIGRMPGLSAMMAKEETPELSLERVRRIIDAMTDEERTHPEMIDESRRARIAAGSGTQPSDVEEFLAQFDQVRTLMREMAGMNLWRRLKLVVGIGKRRGFGGRPPL